MSSLLLMLRASAASQSSWKLNSLMRAKHEILSNSNQRNHSICLGKQALSDRRLESPVLESQKNVPLTFLQVSVLNWSWAWKAHRQLSYPPQFQAPCRKKIFWWLFCKNVGLTHPRHPRHLWKTSKVLMGSCLLQVTKINFWQPASNREAVWQLATNWATMLVHAWTTLLYYIYSSSTSTKIKNVLQVLDTFSGCWKWLNIFVTTLSMSTLSLSPEFLPRLYRMWATRFALMIAQFRFMYSITQARVICWVCRYLF